MMAVSRVTQEVGLMELEAWSVQGRWKAFQWAVAVKSVSEGIEAIFHELLQYEGFSICGLDCYGQQDVEKWVQGLEFITADLILSI